MIFSIALGQNLFYQAEKATKQNYNIKTISVCFNIDRLTILICQYQMSMTSGHTLHNSEEHSVVTTILGSGTSRLRSQI